jgi:hypothetical protein
MKRMNIKAFIQGLLSKGLQLFTLCLIVQSLTCFSQEFPTSDEMKQLNPKKSKGTSFYDYLFSLQAKDIEKIHKGYSDPLLLEDVKRRLKEVTLTGDPSKVFTSKEYAQLQKNLNELRKLEAQFFEKKRFKIPMDNASRLQKLLVKKMSPIPVGQEYDEMYKLLEKDLSNNVLYEYWNKSLPAHLINNDGPNTWGELLFRFSEDKHFREKWINDYPDTLKKLRELTQLWINEDLFIRTANVFNQGEEGEYWVIKRKQRPKVSNPFDLKLSKNIKALIEREFSKTLFFNRLSSIEGSSGEVIFHIEAVEKGRTMELVANDAKNALQSQNYRGANIFRATKTDEFFQRELIKMGKLNVFLGMRTIQVDQVLKLMKLNPSLVLAVGQVGFSLTGGRAQTTSIRTDKPEDQLRKMTATLIDIIEFSQVTDVREWLSKQSQYLIRAVSTGVGAGGVSPEEPTLNNRSIKLKKIKSCSQSIKLLINRF